MYAHVTTYRLGSESETMADVASGEVISDQSARTIASWYHSPSPASTNITLLSHGRPFDTEELRDEIEREMRTHGDTDRPALLRWLDAAEALLADA